MIAYLTAGCLLSGILPSTALAQRTNAPPGHAGVQEYVETIPDGSGNRSTGEIANSRSASPGPGGAGQEAAVLARMTRPQEAAVRARATRPKRTGDKRGRESGDRDQSPATAALGRLVAASGPGGMGAALPIIMLISLLAAAAYAIRRWATARAT